jgi:hypothetical protein
LAGILAWLASVPAASVTAGPAASASASPGRARLLSRADPPLPPGWREQPPLPDAARVHAALAGGTPAWQITILAAMAALFAAALAVTAYGMLAARRHVTTTAARNTAPGGRTHHTPTRDRQSR